jgi:hypothetical protein
MNTAGGIHSPAGRARCLRATEDVIDAARAACTEGTVASMEALRAALVELDAASADTVTVMTHATTSVEPVVVASDTHIEVASLWIYVPPGAQVEVAVAASVSGDADVRCAVALDGKAIEASRVTVEGKVNGLGGTYRYPPFDGYAVVDVGEGTRAIGFLASGRGTIHRWRIEARVTAPRGGG